MGGRGKTSDQTRHFEREGNDTVPGEDSNTRAFNLKGVQWKTVTLARPAVINGQWVCKWTDKENVCNEERLQVLLAELRSLGFVCNIQHQGHAITLHVGVSLNMDRNSECTRVKIEGVDVYRSEDSGRTCLGVVTGGQSPHDSGPWRAA